MAFNQTQASQTMNEARASFQNSLASPSATQPQEAAAKPEENDQDNSDTGNNAAKNQRFVY